MKWSIEFPVDPRWIKNPTNSPLATVGARLGAAGQTKLCVETIGRVLKAHFAAPARSVILASGGKHVAMGTAIGLTVPNVWTVRLVRISTGTVDPITGGASMKAVQDTVARWAGEPNELAPIWRWIEPIGQESKGFRKMPDGSRKAITRVRIELETLEAGEDRRVILETIAQYQEAAKIELRLRQKAKRAKKRQAQPSALDLRDAYLAVAKGVPGAESAVRSMLPKRPAADVRELRKLNGRDPGEEAPARDLADCAACGARAGVACRRVGAEKLLHGVHEGRARAAGMHRDAKPSNVCRHCQGRRYEPSYSVQPLERCGECKGTGKRRAATVPNEPRLVPRACRVLCPWYTKGKSVADPNLTGAPTAKYRVPVEHCDKWGTEVLLTRERAEDAEHGVYWLYSYQEGSS